jgi:hypothetical protein
LVNAMHSVRVHCWQPLLAPGFLLRAAHEGLVDWEVPWAQDPRLYSAWQLLLETARVADLVRPMTAAGLDPGLVMGPSWVARNGIRCACILHATCTPSEGLRPLASSC